MSRFFRIFSLAAMLVIFSIAAIPLHEWGHYWAAQAAGAEIAIGYPTLFSGHFWVSGAQGAWLNAIGLAGGLTVAVAMGVIWLVARWSRTPYDFSTEFAAALIGACQLSYAVVEALIIDDTIPRRFIHVAWIGGAVVVCAAYCRSFKDWITGGE